MCTSLRMMSAGNTRNRSPFTPTQRQELEHQALIFKYMVSGVPIPPELLYSVKRSLESSLASGFFPHQPVGWGCYQMGFGRKTDPEPGRCRRTDGKKWRCSKEAYPDSKYCERHMHRGRNRSRKPVELASSSAATTATSTNTTITNPSSLVNRSLPPLSSFSKLQAHPHQSPTSNSVFNPFLYPHHSSSSGTPGAACGFSAQNNPTNNLFSDAGTSSHVDKDYRYFHGIREGLDEGVLFPETSGTRRNLQDTYQELTMSSYRSYPDSGFQGFADSSKQQEQQHCFVLGTDFKSSSARPMKMEKETVETQKPLHQFFGDWQSKSPDSWLDLASNSRLHTGNISFHGFSSFFFS
ncbi:hypothetical protein K2173_024466 [Erythroxylum novogranatense]|uniref:Growth-regulating factor n=1 Tax=Erythroxylum novogranatense TaxID=1862640 RepID=A0AAV8SUF8_9ROSI|nr:hypothetical protein K2173_024466 [Erythroxylum novogranatense]